VLGEAGLEVLSGAADVAWTRSLHDAVDGRHVGKFTRLTRKNPPPLDCGSLGG
jgi:hypothetical protein